MKRSQNPNEEIDYVQIYRCLKCGGKAIYLSITIRDAKGTLSCYNCGETEDSLYGIELIEERKIK
jgi:transcription elongation factor Elf1